MSICIKLSLFGIKCIVVWNRHLYLGLMTGRRTIYGDSSLWDSNIKLHKQKKLTFGDPKSVESVVPFFV